jgi:hypothetical protein
MKSKVVKVAENIDGPIQTANGVCYNHFIEFENGTKGKYFSKSEKCLKFKEGDDAEFEAEQTKFGVKIKPIQSMRGGGGFQNQPKEPMEFRAATMAMSYAKDFVIARPTMDLLQTANTIYSWIMSKVDRHDEPTKRNEPALCADCHAPEGSPHIKGCRYYKDQVQNKSDDDLPF